MSEKKNSMGRPTKYDPETFPGRAYRLSLLGLKDKDLCDAFGVDINTIYHWKRTKPNFLKAIKEGKEQADEHVAESLYHRARGYSHREEKIFCNDGEIVRAETTKHYPPDTRAIEFWLKNRHPEKWREKQQHELSGPDGGPIEYTDVKQNLQEKIKGIKKRFSEEDDENENDS